MAPEESPSLGERLSGVRARAFVALVVLAALAASGDMTAALSAAAVVLGALALAVVVRPAVHEHWAFNALVGLGIAGYGVAFGLAQTTLVGQVFAAGMAVVGLYLAANVLGLLPGSDHPRRL